MQNPSIIYNAIFKDMGQFCQKQTELRYMIEQLNIRNREDLTALDDKLNEKKKINQEREIRLLAFIDIAKAHCSNFTDTNDIEDYDTGVLSRLTVQINNASRNDPYAEQLFCHASNQLRYLRKDIYTIHMWAENEKKRIDNEYREKLAECQQKEKKLTREILSYIYSETYRNFINVLKSDYSLFGKSKDSITVDNKGMYVSLGRKYVKMPIPSGYEEYIIKNSEGLYDVKTHTIGIPFVLGTNEGCGLFIEYRNENEIILLKGIQNLILNILCYNHNENDQILFIDPIRYNNSSLGILHPLSVGNDSVIDNVPLSAEEAKNKLNVVITQINADERKKLYNYNASFPRRLLIFHNFPHVYDSYMVSQIQQLFANALHYNIIIVATYNLSAKNTPSLDAVELVRTLAITINCDDVSSFFINDLKNNEKFMWYDPPESLPEVIRKKYIDDKPILDMSNNYDKRIGIDQRICYKKGRRSLEKIPFGVDGGGRLLNLDFENSNFATFICGASRSGKSTLLHTLITGILKYMHPDDIELWLVDFKMTEFSRYIDHLPPHIRYIILDESPELVYDIIDRLNDILTKRQNAFKGKWQKLSEVPSEKYMPAILVIIDEFSVMSQMIADSLMSGNDNYCVKLQTLLAKGAALGLHFIFASQGFTSGTRGLNDFSKKQIQQRIAMKTEYNEIKETLDLRSVSNDDQAMMQQLPVHQVLMRIPVDERGNQLKQSTVLYIDDYIKLELLIKKINKTLISESKYDVNNCLAYIDKKSMIVDGNQYLAFSSKKREMIDYVRKHQDIFDDEINLFLGNPRRMLPLYPIVMNDSFCENMLIVAPQGEKMAMSSIIMSIAESLKLVEQKIVIWTTKKNEIYRLVAANQNHNIEFIAKELDEVCQEISRIKKAIDNKIKSSQYTVIMGTEELLLDMSYQITDKKYYGSKNKTSVVTMEKRALGEMDLNSILTSLSMGKDQKTNMENMKIHDRSPMEDVYEENENISEHRIYDARNDLKFILTQGPRLGYHFIVLFNTAVELNQNKIDLSIFKHKILFRMPKSDVIDIIGSYGSGVVAEMDNHTFRYLNGIDAVSFRPYLHSGLTWDGWSVHDNVVMNAINEEEEYLM